MAPAALSAIGAEAPSAIAAAAAIRSTCRHAAARARCALRSAASASVSSSRATARQRTRSHSMSVSRSSGLPRIPRDGGARRAHAAHRGARPRQRSTPHTHSSGAALLVEKPCGTVATSPAAGQLTVYAPIAARAECRQAPSRERGKPCGYGGLERSLPASGDLGDDLSPIRHEHILTGADSANVLAQPILQLADSDGQHAAL